MTRSSRVAALLLGAGLVVGPAAAWAPPASADGAVLTPAAGTVFDNDTTVRLEARVEARSGATEMRLVDPSGTARTVDSAPASLQDQTLRHALDTSCPEYPGAPCSGRRPARNGTWTVQLSGGATDSRSFVLSIPPRPPSGVRAEATGPREVVVTWDRGSEPDLVAYDVLAGDGRVLAPGDTTCAGGTCRTVVRYDSDGPSTEMVAVRAARSLCPDCDGRLTATSGDVTVARPAAAPAPAPESPRGAEPAAPADGASPAPGATAPAGDGGGTGGAGGTGAEDGAASGGGPAGGPTSGSPGATGAGSGGGTTAGGTGGAGSAPGGSGTSGAPAVAFDQADADAFALSFKAFGPKIGLPKLPPLPATGVALPAVAAETDGAFDPQLPFDEQVVQERVPTTALNPAQRLTRTVSSAIDSERLVRGVAAGLVLLLVCAHVRRWLAQSPPQP